MPAILTHDFFGRAIYEQHRALIGVSDDEREAFLLGNQGPDPLFYAIIDPRRSTVFYLGRTIHNEKPTEFLTALHDAAFSLNAPKRRIARPYVLGFLCHYLLDSHVHPFVFAQQYALCDAGVEGLDRKSGNEVHATIEASLDEEVLYTLRHETIATYAPCEQVLRASDEVLSVVSDLYAQAVEAAYGLPIARDTFAKAVRCFRLMQRFLYSPTGQKREIAGAIEASFRRYSLMRAMSHRPLGYTECTFDNHEHLPWKDPADGSVSTAGFWDLYHEARRDFEEALARFDARDFSEKDAQRITHGKNFAGEIVD